MIAACDVAIDPANPNNVYCAFFGNGVYKSTNAGAANPIWKKQAGGLPGSGIGRIALAVSPSAPSIVYAVLGDTSESIRDIYRTKNEGAAWASLGVDASGVTGSSSYTLDVAVDPSTPDIVYVAGTSLYKATRDTGTGTWSLAEIGADIHPDMHYIAFDPVDHLVVYAGTDGGIYRSSDGGASWSDTINEGLCITQFQVVDHHPTSDAFVIGGTQDNGTEQYRNSPVFYHSDDGDGGFVAVDPTHPRTLFHTYYGVSLARSTEAGDYGSWFDVTPGIEGNCLFYAPFALDATNPRNIAYGTDRICLDDAQGVNEWSTQVALPGITGRVSSISYVNSTLIYAGTSTGKVYRLTHAGAKWTADSDRRSAPPRTLDLGRTGCAGRPQHHCGGYVGLRHGTCVASGY